MSTRKFNEESISLKKLCDYSYNFPDIVEVDQDTPRFKKGELLWLLRYCQDEDTGKKAVRICRFDSPSVEFPIVLEDPRPLMVHRRKYEDIKKSFFDTKGPLMDISMLANLVEDSDKPVFAVSTDEQENRGERILIHTKKKMKGYLASGRQNYVMIPYNFKGTFTQNSPSISNKIPKFRSILDIVKSKWLGKVKVVGDCRVRPNIQVDNIYKGDVLQLKDTATQFMKNDYNTEDNEDTGIVLFKRLWSEAGRLGDIRVASSCTGQFQAQDDNTMQGKDAFIVKDYKGRFPVTLTYVDTSSDSYFVSLDDDTLHKESPLTISGICNYTATYTTLQIADSSVSPFQSNQMFPDYCPINVRAASPIPVRIHEMTNASKPRETVHILTPDMYTKLAQTFAATASRFSSVQTLDRPRAVTNEAEPPRVQSFPGADIRPIGNAVPVFPRRRSRSWTSKADLFQDIKSTKGYQSTTLPRSKTCISEANNPRRLPRMFDMTNRPVPPVPQSLTEDVRACQMKSMPNLHQDASDDDDYVDMEQIREEIKLKLKSGT